MFPLFPISAMTMLLVLFCCSAVFPKRRSGTPGGFIKRYPTMPTASRISFDFLHYIRPPPGAMSAPKESFDQLVQFLSNWMACSNANGGNGEDDNDDDKANGGNAFDVYASNGGGGGDIGGADSNYANGHDGDGAVKRKKERLIVNFLRHLCHVFYFNCNQVNRRNVVAMSCINACARSADCGTLPPHFKPMSSTLKRTYALRP